MRGNLEGVVSWWAVLQQPRGNQPRLEEWDERLQKSCLHGGAALCLVAQWCPTLCHPMDCRLPGSFAHGDSLGKNTGVGCCALLQRIFLTQIEIGLPHCRQILYPLSHQGNPWIREWVAYPFSRGSSQLRNETNVSGIAAGFFISWAIRKALSWWG